MNRRSSDRDSWDQDSADYIDQEKWPRVVRACIWIALVLAGWALLLAVARAAARL